MFFFGCLYYKYITVEWAFKKSKVQKKLIEVNKNVLDKTRTYVFGCAFENKSALVYVTRSQSVYYSYNKRLICPEIFLFQKPSFVPLATSFSLVLSLGKPETVRSGRRAFCILLLNSLTVKLANNSWNQRREIS